MQRIKVRFNAGHLGAITEGISNVVVNNLPYVIHITGYCQEWAIIVTYIPRQDGKVVWLVQLVQVDDVVRTFGSRSPLDLVAHDIEWAIGNLTRQANWVEPIN